MGDGVQLSRWRGAGWVAIFLVVTIALLAGGYFTGFALASADREVEANTAEPIVVTAKVEQQIPQLPPIPIKVGSASQFEYLASTPAGAQSAVITASPYSVGDEIREGTLLIAISGSPRFALQPTTPFYRDLTLGLVGPDVRSLNESLVRGGLMTGDQGETYTWETRAAVARMYDVAGYTAPGIAPGDLLPASSIAMLPRSGMIIRKVAETNEVSTDGAVVVAATSAISSASARLDSVQIESVQAGMPAVLQVSGSTEPSAGTITAISEFREADAEGTASFPGFDVTITLTEPLASGAGKSGMLLIESGSEPVSAIPVSAIRDAGGQTYVWVQRGQGFSKVEITVASESDGWAFVGAESELRTGDKVRLTP